MLVWSAWLLAAGITLGLVLVVLSQTMDPARQPLWPGAVHGAVGVVAFVLLLLGLHGSARGVLAGAGSFGAAAAWLTAATLCLGGWLAAGRLRRRPPAMVVIGVHATLGVAALVMLATYLTS